jgi:hypothetical protein
MFKEEIENKKNPRKTLNNKISKKKEIPEILDDTVEEAPRYSPKEGERVIFNRFERFTGPDDELCRVIEKKSVKDSNYYKLELIVLKRTKSKGVPWVEWGSGRYMKIFQRRRSYLNQNCLHINED